LDLNTKINENLEQTSTSNTPISNNVNLAAKVAQKINKNPTIKNGNTQKNTNLH
jgi:hypothetical protein